MLVLDAARESRTFVGIDAEPVPSLLRGFSAPVVLDDGLADDELLVLLAHDADPFNRWEAGQRLALARLLEGIARADDAAAPAPLDDAFVDAMRGVLRDPRLDAAFKELVLTLPAEGYVAEQLETVDPQRIHAVHQAMQRQLAAALRDDWAWALDAHAVAGGYSPDPVSAGRRALAGRALAMLCLDAVERGDAVWPGRAWQRFKDAANMTERSAALEALLHAGAALADAALERFHALFAGEPLVVDKWFSMQARAPETPDGRVFERVRALLGHADFSIANPNRARSLLMSFCMFNPAGFHRARRRGLRLLGRAHVIEIDAVNPQLAARLARVMDRWSVLAEPYRDAARAALVRVAALPKLSSDVREVVERALAA